ncbi:hypothetical protein [Streptomyces sp. NPDC097619]|uniref:hypothetical protein n=1 Tax=Streptomyces sp. NPDC097619 TaxID=3157228 RepID=UPI0033183FB3
MGREEFERDAIRAGARSGVLDAVALYGIALSERDIGERLTAAREALAQGRDAVARERFAGFLEACGDVQVRLVVLRDALAAGLPTAGDLAGFALDHRDRRIRRLSARTLMDRSDGDALRGRLLTASDAVVRGAAVGRLGSAEELVPFLADPSAWVRGLARAGLRTVGVDPGAAYRSLCARPGRVTAATVSGLVELRGAGDAPLLRSLLKHADGTVRARALDGLLALRALGTGELPGYADDPDPRVGAVVLRALREDRGALRSLLGHHHARIRAGALTRLEHGHGVGWEEALPFLSDPAPEVSRTARSALSYAGRELSSARLVALTGPGGAPELRSLAMEVLGRRAEAPEVLVNALGLLDDPEPGVRAAAREQAQVVVYRPELLSGPRGEEIRALVELHGDRLVIWRAAYLARIRAARERAGRWG